MAKFVFRDIFICYGGRNLSGELSSLSLEYGMETPDATVLSDTSRRRLPGLVSVNSTHNGWWDSVSATDSVDKDLFDSVGGLSASEFLATAALDGGASGDVSLSWPAHTAEYSPGATVGEVFAYTFNTSGNGRLVRGTVLDNATYTTTTNGTAVQVGAVLATETIYSSLHVYAASGTSPTLDVTIESDDSSGFASPVTRMTHTQFTAVGAEQQSLAGAVTDDWWRAVFTIGGGSPSFTAIVALGILPTKYV